MLEACARVIEFTDGMDQAAFLADARTYHATLHNLALIGQAATHIPSPSAIRIPVSPGAASSARGT